MKQTLIFLHGGPGYSDYLNIFFNKQFPEHHSIFYTQSRTDSTSFTDLINELDDIVSKSQNVWLCGHSWGGAFALEYLRLHGSKIKGFILISSFISYSKLQRYFLTELNVRGIKHYSSEDLFFTVAERQVSKRLQSILADFNKDFCNRINSEFLERFDGEFTFKNLKIPILNIFGSLDLRVPAMLAREIRLINPAVKDIEIQSAGHFPFLLKENRKVVVEEITNFLNR